MDIPVGVLRASVRRIWIQIPWRQLQTERCAVKLEGLELIVQPLSVADLCMMWYFGERGVVL